MKVFLRVFGIKVFLRLSQKPPHQAPSPVGRRVIK